MRWATSRTVFPLTFLADPDGDVNALTVPVRAAGRAAAVRPATRRAAGPRFLRRLCGTYAMGPIELTVGQKGERTLTITAPGSPPSTWSPARPALRA